MKNTKIIVKTRSKTYPIYYGNNILSKTNGLIKKNLPDVKKICIISDNKLPKLLLVLGFNLSCIIVKLYLHSKIKT